jgi:hypothetical protein
MVAPAVLYVGEQLHSGMRLPFLSVGAAALAAIAAVLLLPETRGQPQPDTVEQVEQLFGSHFKQSRAASAEGGGGGGGGVCVRQSSKLQRLLSRLSSSSGSRNEGSWTLPAVPDSDGRYGAVQASSGWRALGTEEEGWGVPVLPVQEQQSDQQELVPVRAEVPVVTAV